MTDLLSERDGLSEPLRVLLADYPREAWEGDPEFSELIQFWLSRHAMFRELLQRVTDLLEGHLDRKTDPQRTVPALSHYGNALLGGLHQHHHIEDDHYFPRIVGLEPRLARGFDILDRDHHALTERLDGLAQAANAVIRAEDMRDPVDAALTETRRLDNLLDRHLWDEEELVVPIPLKHAFKG
ncbi:MAG: hemerythrin domain-containing protein [Shimia sp.]